MKKRYKSEGGFVAVDALLAVAILIILSSVVIGLVLNIYKSSLSMHKASMATDYAVEILESAKALNYNDTKLVAGNYSKVGNVLLGVNLGNNYDATLFVENYNSLEGNENKEDVIKILKVVIGYTDNDLYKNMQISTLKLNESF